MGATAQRQHSTNPSSDRPVEDGTLCRQLSPLPGPVAEQIERARGSRSGLPFNTSPRHAVQSALRFHQARIREALRTATDLAEVLCIAVRWTKIKGDYETLLREPLRYETEPKGDDEIRKLILELVTPDILSDLINEIVTNVLRDDPYLNSAEVAEAITKNLLDWVRDTLLQALESWAIHSSKQQSKSLGELIVKACNGIGKPINRYQASKIARRMTDQLKNPIRLGATATRRLLKVYGSAPAVFLRVLLTPSKTAGRLAEDPNPHMAASIERDIQSALTRVSSFELDRSEWERTLPAPATPMWRAPRPP